MGIIRKTMSVGTVGLVDFRSDKERTAAYTKGAKKQAKKQTHLMRQQVAAARAAGAQQYSAQQYPVAPVAPVGPPAGWYAAPSDPPGLTRWWDGTAWTGFTQTAPCVPGAGTPQ